MLVIIVLCIIVVFIFVYDKVVEDGEDGDIDLMGPYEDEESEYTGMIDDEEEE